MGLNTYANRLSLAETLRKLAQSLDRLLFSGCFSFSGGAGVTVPRQWPFDTCETVAIGESHWVDFLLQERDC